ncbi:CU044_5270 family protein [Nonomuraea dietziae]|uniref:CU044_5270 family protein n=1 Tax=Nonomuraea dietziae TaxID=65515 RepID=UPI003427E872
MKEFQLIDEVMPDLPPADQARAMAVRARTLGGARRRHRLPALSRVALAAAAVSLVLVGGFAAVSMLGGSGGETAAVQEPAAVLGAAADRLAAQPPGTGAWWRREMLHVSRVRTKDNPTFTVEWRVKEVLWVDREGKQRTEQGDVVAKPFTPADERAWKDAGSPKLCKPSDDCQLGRVFFTSLGQTFKPVAGLPTDPEALKAEMLRHLPGSGVDSQEAWLWDAGQTLLLYAESTPGTRAALYRILADLPGTRVADGVTDLDGRTGVALVFGDSPARRQIIIDRDSGDLLAVQNVLIPADGGASDPGDGGVSDSYVVKRLGWTDEAPQE